MRKHEIGKISLRNVVISFLGVDAHRPHSGGTWVKIGPTEVRELIRLNIFRLEGRGVRVELYIIYLSFAVIPRF